MEKEQWMYAQKYIYTLWKDQFWRKNGGYVHKHIYTHWQDQFWRGHNRHAYKVTTGINPSNKVWWRDTGHTYTHATAKYNHLSTMGAHGWLAKMLDYETNGQGSTPGDDGVKLFLPVGDVGVSVCVWVGV